MPCAGFIWTVGIIQVHPVFEDLFAAFDTRPPVAERQKDGMDDGTH